MVKFKLGINTGFALNRFTPPEDWIPLVGKTLGLRRVQFTADLLNPSLPDAIKNDQIKRIRKLCKAHDVHIVSTFTSAFTRVNHLAHPDPEIRAYWVDWFKQWVDITVALGADNMGSHFGIFTTKDVNDPARKAERFQQNVDGWGVIAEYGKKQGLKTLTWEPMSIPREQGETLMETRRIQNAVGNSLALPMRLCLDVDHGDVSSPDPDDTNPYKWLAQFAAETHHLHLKQSLPDKSGHWPFIMEKNKIGKIQPDQILQTLDEAGVTEMEGFLELSFREREPFESHVIEDLKSSVDFWKPAVELS